MLDSGNNRMYNSPLGQRPLAEAKGRGPIHRDRATSNEEGPMLMQTLEDSRLRPLWRLTHVPFKMRGELSQQKDVKNEGTSGDMYENKGREKMKKGTSGDVDENTQVTL